MLLALGAGAAAVQGAWGGYWPGVNGPALCTALAASLAALSALGRVPRRLPMAFWPCLGVGLVSLSLAPWHRQPLQDFIGSPELRESGASWLGIAWLTLAIATLARYGRRTRVALLISVLAVSVAYAALAWPDAPAPGHARWYHYDDQLGLSALHLTLFASGLAVGWRWRGLALAVALALLAVSDNRSAVAALLVLSPAVYALLLLLRQRCRNVTRRSLAAALVVTIPLALAALEGWALAYPSGAKLPLAADLAERGAYVGVVGAAMMKSPQAWVLGQGWGGFVEVASVYGPTAQAWKGLDPNDAGRWSGVDGMGIHSHHGPIEALLAGGLPLMAVLLILGTVHAWPTRQRRRWEWSAALAVGLSLVHATWFLLPLNQVSYALALATAPLGGRLTQGRRSFVQLAALLAALILIASAALAYRQVQAPLPAEYAEHTCLTASWPDRHSGGYVLAQSLSQALRGARRLAEPLPEAERLPRRRGLAAALCGVVQLGPQQASVRTQVIMVLALSALALELPQADFAELAARHRPDWERWNFALLEAAPERGDLAMALAAAAMAEGNAALISELAAIIVRQRPDDPVAAWLLGLAELTRGELEPGLARLQALVAAGIGRRIAIAPELLALLATATGVD